jgi:N-acetylneuraminic acid mutarotase
MKRIILILVTLIALVAVSKGQSNAQAPSPDCDIVLGEWVKSAPIPSSHLEGAAAVVDNKLYVLSGFRDTSLRISNRVDVYNPATNAWETATNPRRSVPLPFSHAQAAVDGKNIWIAGGFVGNHPAPPTDAVWRYDTAQDLWYQGPKLPQKRAGGLLVRQDRFLHYIGGTSSDRNTSYNDHWRLNLDNTASGWQRVSSFPQARNHVSGAFINGMIYAVGGQFKHDHNPVDLKFLHAFNVATGQWSSKSDLPFPRSHFEPGTIVTDGRIIIVGGRANQNGFGFGQIVNVTEYNPTTDSWRELRPLPLKLIAPVAVRIGDKLIVTNGGTNWKTGQLNTYISQINYDCPSTPIPPTATFTAVPPTETPTIEPTATVEPTTETPPGGPSETTSTPIVTDTADSPSPTPSGQRVDSLLLVNALTDQPITLMSNGLVIDCAQIGTTKLNILASTVPYPVGSLRFSLNEVENYKTENGAPYTIGGNNGADYFDWTLPDGDYTLSATPWSDRNATGELGTPLSIAFTVVNCNG